MKYQKILTVSLGALVLLSNSHLSWAAAGDNIALSKTYTLTPAPNYDHPSVDINNQNFDDTDLTDGAFYEALHWYEESVTWQFPAARIDMDLNMPDCQSNGTGCSAISEIKFHVHGNHHGSGIYCPESATFEVSDDGVSYHPVSHWTRPEGYPEVACGPAGPSLIEGKPKGWNFLISSGTLQTRGAHMRLTIKGSGNLIFIDEVQVVEGTDVSLTNYLPVDNLDSGLTTLGTEWRVFDVNPFAVVNERSLPANGLSDTSGINLQLAKSETGTASLTITNPYETDLVISPVISDLVNAAGVVIPSSALKVRQGIDTDSADFSQRADALISLASQPASISSRRVGHLNIDIDVPDTSLTGVFSGTLQLNCNSGCSQNKSIPISLEVLPIDLPKIKDLQTHFFDWSYSIPEGYGFSSGDLADERAAIRQWAGQNAHVSYLAPLPTWGADGQPQALNFTEFDAMLDRYPDTRMHILYLAGGSAGRLSFGDNACYPSTLWNDTYSWWIQQLATHMSDRNIPYSKFAFYMVDEPREAAMLGFTAACGDPVRNRLQLVQDTARLIRAVDPQLQVWVDSNEKTPPMALLNEIAAENLVDIWVPQYDVFLEDQMVHDFYTARQQAGEQVWLYNGNLMSISSNHPHKDARIIPWTLWQNKITGYGYWALFAPGRLAIGGASSVWDPFDATRLDFSMIYLHDFGTPAGIPLDEAIIPSRRLTGWRQGIEDYRYLTYLNDLILLRTSQGISTATYTATLNQAVADVLNTPDDVTQANRSRSQIIQSIDDLSDSDNDTVINADDNCLSTANTDQADIDSDGAGDACDTNQLHSIVVTKATFNNRKSKLTVEANSDYRGQANLEIVGYGSMTWVNKKGGLWIFTESVSVDPGASVTVKGLEGEITVQLQ